MKMLCSLWLHVFICVLQCRTGFPYLVNNTIKNHLCHQEERQLLLQFKQTLFPPQEELAMYQRCNDAPRNYSKPMYWNRTTDCCVWDGVTCDEWTGHVIGLDLSCSALAGIVDSNSTLFRLTHLRNLNLAYNNFLSSEISFKFGHLNSLTHLNLSYSGFAGHIPVELYHLSNLVSLDITTDNSYPMIYSNIKALFGNMTKLRVVLLEGVNISSEMPINMSSFLTHLDLGFTGVHGNLPATIFEKPNLQILNLIGNDGLTGSLPSFNRTTVRLIQHLVISGTSMSGRLPDSLGFMNNLNRFILSQCKFSGPIPVSIGNLSEITEINLSSNEFNGDFPTTIRNLRQLTLLDLSYNYLQGQLPDAFSDLQKLTSLSLGGNGFIGMLPSSLTNMSQLKELDISSNALAGQIPSSLTNMSRLKVLDISSNKLTGPFPSRTGHRLQKLSEIHLSNNCIQGTVPSWLLMLPSLVQLDLSSNRLTGEIGEFNSQSLINLDLRNNQLNIELESFYNLTEIVYLYLSNNMVTEPAQKVVNVSLPNLGRLELSSCEMEEFPHLLKHLSGLSMLDLSHNKIHGPIPSWFSSLQLSYLNLSFNSLTHAPWQQLGINLRYLDLQSNSLQDTFPSSICNMSELFILNLSSNKLRGTIPECIGTFSNELEVLDLRRNELRGKIPTTIGGTDYWLVNLGLNENNLEGPLPRSLANCTSLEVLDVGNNMIYDTFPWWLQNLTSLKVLILKSNRFNGLIRPPLSNNSFCELQIIDLSYNSFTGTLPEKLFARLQAMKKQDEAATSDLYMGSSDGYHYSMTLSVKGDDVEFARVLRIFTTIDLSRNNFHGHIPESITDLSLLRLLNLSHNSISGNIPPALGRMTKLEQIDLSSNELTGEIPQTLTNLTFLAVLNLSHNHLVGPIPTSNQFLTFPNDSYVDNLGLCGFPLTRSCGDGKVPPSPGVFEEEDGLMMGFTWKVVVIGYGCGVVLGFILGYVMISTENPKWLARFVYVEAAIILKKRKKRGRMVQGRR